MKHVAAALLSLFFIAPHAGHAQSTAGDWALGFWKGIAYDIDGNRTALQPVDMELVIDKQPSGGYVCKSRVVTTGSPSEPVPCVIDANTVRYTASPSGNKVELTRKNEALEGIAEAYRPLTHYQMKLTR